MKFCFSLYDYDSDTGIDNRFLQILSPSFSDHLTPQVWGGWLNFEFSEIMTDFEGLSSEAMLLLGTCTICSKNMTRPTSHTVKPKHVSLKTDTSLF